MRENTSRGNAGLMVGWAGVATAVIAGYFSGVLGRRAWDRRGNSPRPNVMGGAVSAVTGGSPEDINGMPPNTNLLDDEPVVDGSRLSAG